MGTSLDDAIRNDPRYRPSIGRTRRQLERIGYCSPALWDKTVLNMCAQFERDAEPRYWDRHNPEPGLSQPATGAEYAAGRGAKAGRE